MPFNPKLRAAVHTSQADDFVAEVENIMKLPTAIAAANAGGLTEEARADYEHRMAWVQQAAASTAGSEANQALVETVRNWSDLQRQLFTSDLAHKWRIDAVTHRYQQHMEKVCSHGQFLQFMPSPALQ